VEEYKKYRKAKWQEGKGANMNRGNFNRMIMVVK